MKDDKPRFPKIDPLMFDMKRYKRSIRKSFESGMVQCRFALNKEKLSIFKEQLCEIRDVLSDTLSNKDTFNTGNIYFIFGVFDTHFNFLKDASVKCNSVDKRALPELHNVILEKQEQFIGVLKRNLKQPIKDYELEDMVRKQEDVQRTSDGSSDTRRTI